jgi:hypothetical protein
MRYEILDAPGGAVVINTIVADTTFVALAYPDGNYRQVPEPPEPAPAPPTPASIAQAACAAMQAQGLTADDMREAFLQAVAHVAGGG